MISSRARRGNRHGAETIAHNLNRRHQIVLNLELSRLEMQKRMLERYFHYEIELIRTRQAKLLFRQREVKASQPKMAAPPAEKLREKKNSVFITSLSLDDAQRTSSLLPVIQSSHGSLNGTMSRGKKAGDHRKMRPFSTESPRSLEKVHFVFPKDSKEKQGAGHNRKHSSEESSNKGDLHTAKEVDWGFEGNSSTKENSKRTRDQAQMRAERKDKTSNLNNTSGITKEVQRRPDRNCKLSGQRGVSADPHSFLNSCKDQAAANKSSNGCLQLSVAGRKREPRKNSQETSNSVELPDISERVSSDLLDEHRDRQKTTRRTEGQKTDKVQGQEASEGKARGEFHQSARTPEHEAGIVTRTQSAGVK